MSMSTRSRLLCFPPFLLLMRCWGWGDIVQSVQGRPTVTVGRAEAVVGGRVDLPCEAAEGHKDITLVLWYHQSLKRPIYSYDIRNEKKPEHWKENSSLGSRVRYEPATSTPVLKLHDIVAEDAGRYRCRVDFRRRAGTSSDTILNVVVPPLQPVLYLGDGTQVERDQSFIGPFLLGQSVQVECRVGGGDPPPIVTWWRGGELIRNKDAPVDPSSSSRKRRRGIYTTNTSVTTATQVPLNPITPAALVAASTTSPLSSTPSPESPQPSSYRSPRPVVISTLHIDQLTREDLHTSFVCQASNSNMTEPRQVTATIEMYFPPEQVTLLGARGGPLSAGKPYELICSSKGARPPASISWWLEGNQLTNVTSAVHSAGQETRSVLTLLPRPSDEGKYLTCQAESPVIAHPTLVDAALLKVYYKPKAIIDLNKATSQKDDILDTTSVNSVLTSVSVREKGGVILHCNVVANPNAFRVVWKKNGEVIASPMKGLVAMGQALRVVRATREHAGTYTCSASNVEGESSSAELNLQVAFPPECAPGQLHVQGAARGEAITIKCQVLSFPSPSRFEWHLNTTRGKTLAIPEDQITSRGGVSTFVYTPYSRNDYGNLMCRGVNVVGRQEEACVYRVVPAGIPDGPENCSVAQLRPFVIHVQCQAGYDGGLPQTFVGEAYDATTRTLISNHSNAIEPLLELESLTPSTEFLVSVYAVNVKGASRRKILYVTTPSDVTGRRIEGPIGDGVGDDDGEEGGAEEDMNLLSSMLEGTPFLALLVGALCGFILVALVAAVVVLRVQKACRRGRSPSSPARGCPRGASPATTSTTASVCSSKRGLLFSEGDVPPHFKRIDMDPLHHKPRQRKCHLIPFEASTILEVDGENDEGYEDDDDEEEEEEEDEEESLWEEDDEELEYMEDETEPYGKDNQRTALALIRNDVGQWTRPEDNEVIYGVGNLRHLRFGQSRSPQREGFFKSRMKRNKDPVKSGKPESGFKHVERKTPKVIVTAPASSSVVPRGERRGSGKRVGVCLPTRGKRQYSRKRNELEETDSSEISTYTRPSLIVSRVPRTIIEGKQASRKGSNKSHLQRENSINNKNPPKVAHIRKGGKHSHRGAPRVSEAVKVVKPPSPVYSTPVMNPQVSTITENSDDLYASVHTGPQEPPTTFVAIAATNKLSKSVYESALVDVSVLNEKNHQQNSLYEDPDPEIISAFRPYIKPEFEAPSPQLSNRVPKSPLSHPNSKLQNVAPHRKLSPCTPPSFEIVQTEIEERPKNVTCRHAEEDENGSMTTSFNTVEVEAFSPGEVLANRQPSPLRSHANRGTNSNAADLQPERLSPRVKTPTSPQIPTNASPQEVKSSTCIMPSTRQQRPTNGPTINLQLQPYAQPLRSQPSTPEPQSRSEPVPPETKSSPRINIQQESLLEWSSGTPPPASQTCAATRRSPSLLQPPLVTDVSPSLSQARHMPEASHSSQTRPMRETSPLLSQTLSVTDASPVTSQTRPPRETSPSLPQAHPMRKISLPVRPPPSRPSPPQRTCTSSTTSSPRVYPSTNDPQRSSSPLHRDPQCLPSPSVCPPHSLPQGPPSPLVCPPHSLPQGGHNPSICLPHSDPQGPNSPSSCPPHNPPQDPPVSRNSSYPVPVYEPYTTVVSIHSQSHGTSLTSPSFVVSLPSFSGVTRSESPRQSSRPEEPQRRSPSNPARFEVQGSSPTDPCRAYEAQRVSPSSHVPGISQSSSSKVPDDGNPDSEELPTATITSTRPRASPRVRPLDRSGQRFCEPRSSPRNRSFHVVPPVSPAVAKAQLKISKSYN
ncbi:uncharacterized protein LOC143027083 [Oratosquilla oratoria]|uniref:uncharacterized protein LOC143027083 n=1 Tax=Oratosquilla oratoria TaxID=337810 RepID=UPI003F75D6D4